MDTNIATSDVRAWLGFGFKMSKIVIFLAHQIQKTFSMEI